MFEDAVAANLEDAVDEAEELEQMTKDEPEKSYGFGHLGDRMQKRVPLKQPYE